MKCPLLILAYHADRDFVAGIDDECLKDDCAWWVIASKSCAMEAIPRIIGYLGSELKTIEENLLLAGLPTKERS